MNVVQCIGYSLIGIGILVYLFRETAFQLLVFGMFDGSYLNRRGHSVFKGAGLFCIVEGGLFVMLA